MAMVPLSPAAVAGVYQKVQAGGASAGGFGNALDRAIQGVVDSSHAAETQATQALAGGGNLTNVVTAVSQAELALQATNAIRDRVVSAYQEIMRMPI